jgi:hypothetical protein
MVVMKKFAVAALGLGLAAVTAGAASAHHSTAMYDSTHPVTVKGVVKEFTPSNPHMQLTIVATTGKDAGKVIQLEGQSVQNMYRLGFRRGMFNVGDTLTVVYSPLRNGDLGGLFTSITTADGKFAGLKPPTPTSAAAAPGVNR